MLYDICNAFPSIAHKWLFAVLRALRLNLIIFNLTRVLYKCANAYAVGLGTGDWLFQILAGVRTGCPLSAPLFFIAINQIFDMFIEFSDKT